MKNFHEYKQWIKDHLPEDYDIDECDLFYQFYYDGLTVYCNGDRDIYTVKYVAKDREDLRLWAYKQCCDEISYGIELYTREENEDKWRYSMDHVENGEWMYTERKDYVYNTIEDTRLCWFEEYLRMIKPVLPQDHWEREIKKYVEAMNVNFKKAHWDYDKDRMAFVEISDSKPSFGKKYERTGEPTKKQIMKE